LSGWTDTESEPFKDPIDTVTLESPLTIAPLIPLSESTLPVLDPILCRTARMAVRIPHAMSSDLFADLPSRKRYRGTSKLVEDSEEDDDEEDEEIEESIDSDSVSEDAKDEGPTAEDEDPAVEDEGHTTGVESPGMDDKGYGLDDESRASVIGMTVSAPLGLGYRALRRRELALEEGDVYSKFETPPSPEWISSSLPISPSPSNDPSPISSPMIPLTVPSPIATPAVVETEGFLTVLGAQVQMQRGLISDHAVRLEELSPALFERYDKDIGELFTRSRVRPVLALEAWAGQTDAQRIALWHAISDVQGENRNLRLQLAEDRRA
ncbi:hypothetical protein Tco_0930083, partial [Tanacetum coccineum]